VRPRIARLEFDDGLDECLIRPFRAGLRRARRRREQPAVLAWYQRLMNRQERRRAEGDGDLSDAFWTEEERPESAEQPVALRQVRRAPASTAQDDHLLLEQEILRHHRSHATGATATLTLIGEHPIIEIRGARKSSRRPRVCRVAQNTRDVATTRSRCEFNSVLVGLRRNRSGSLSSRMMSLIAASNCGSLTGDSVGGVEVLELATKRRSASRGPFVQGKRDSPAE